MQHSCLPLVLALRSLQSVLSAASLPKSSVSAETRTEPSFVTAGGPSASSYTPFMKNSPVRERWRARRRATTVGAESSGGKRCGMRWIFSCFMKLVQRTLDFLIFSESQSKSPLIFCHLVTVSILDGSFTFKGHKNAYLKIFSYHPRLEIYFKNLLFAQSS